MFKKLLFVSSLFVLAACANEKTEYPAAKYKISDKDMKAFIFKVNNYEQCIHPELVGLSYEEAEAKVYSQQSHAESNVWARYAIPKAIKETVGEENLNTIISDHDSLHYFWEKHSRLNNQKGKVDPQECQAFKEQFQFWLKTLNSCGCSH